LSEAYVYVNVTYMTNLLKVSVKNLDWEVNVYVNVTSRSSQSEYENFWVRGKCLCECSTYDCSSQSKYEQSWVRQMLM
jgi:hypothetical protein